MDTMKRPLRPRKGGDTLDSASHLTEAEAYELGDMHSARTNDEKPEEGDSPTVVDHTPRIDPVVLDEMIVRYVPVHKRPKHRLGFLGLWGRKVDTIEWCKVCTSLSSFVRYCQVKEAALRLT